MESKSKEAYELDVKNLILHRSHLFVANNDLTTVVFEKVIARHTRADCLIFSHEKGIIGIEIKTARDSVARLDHQIRDYEKVCNYVYVLIHDDMVEEVAPIVKPYGNVGIIAYTEMGNNLYPGVVQPATLNANQDLKAAFYHLTWSAEETRIARKVNQDKPLPVHRKNDMTKFLCDNYDKPERLIWSLYYYQDFEPEHDIKSYEFASDA